MVVTKAFIYKWIHLPTKQWYIGSRTRQGCHPDDGYICSSKTVKPRIQANPEEWFRIILMTGEPIMMRLLEAELLSRLNVVKDPMSLNKHNGTGKFEGTKKGHCLGIKRTQEFKENVSKYQSGRSKSEATIQKLSLANHGVPLTEERKQRIRDSLNNPEEKAKRVERNKQRVWTLEMKAKVSASLKEYNRKKLI